MISVLSVKSEETYPGPTDLRTKNWLTEIRPIIDFRKLTPVIKVII